MFTYYLSNALRSARKNPVLTSLVAFAIAAGISVSITMLTIYRVMDSNPIPDKSDSLHRVLIDSWDPLRPFSKSEPEKAPFQMTWRDATALLALGEGKRQVAMFESLVIIQPDDKEQLPFEAATRVTNGDFFPMFDVPFRYGGGWDKTADQDQQLVIVLSMGTNDRLFSGQNSVGKKVMIDNQYFTVTGVLDKWTPTPRFYDVVNSPFNDISDVFIPISLTRSLKLGSAGSDWGWKAETIVTFDDWLNSESVWLQYWTEFDSTSAKSKYLNHLDNYVTEQKKLGRFERPMNNQIYNVMDWMAYNEVVMTEVRMLVGLGFLFFVVCLLCTISLLVTKFNGRNGEMSLRRALGANRGQILAQNLVEVGVIGVVGGILGTVVALINLDLMKNAVSRAPSTLFEMDWTIVTIALAISIIAALVAGFYPAWRSCLVTPARELKIN